MARIELRCDAGVLFGILEDGVLEVKCRHQSCGVRPGVVIIHRISATSGNLLGTRKFQDPAYKRGGKHGNRRNSASVRSA